MIQQYFVMLVTWDNMGIVGTMLYPNAEMHFPLPKSGNEINHLKLPCELA